MPTKTNIKPWRRKPAAGKKPARAKRRQRIHEREFIAALWSVPMCCECSGLAHPYLLKLIHAGTVEAVAMGSARDDVRPSGVVHRSCSKFLVVARSFREFVEGLGARGKLSA